MERNQIPPANRAIGDAGARFADGVLTVELRLPWYRSLPLSTLEIESIDVDGVAVDLSSATLTLEDRRYALAEMEEVTGHVWYVLDSAWLQFPASLADGPHEVALTLTSYPPYIHGLKRPVRDSMAFQTGGGHG